MTRARGREVVVKGAAIEPGNPKGVDGARPARRRSPDVLERARGVTERTRALRAEAESLAEVQQSARLANQRFVELYDFMPVPYLITSDLGVILEINESGLQLLGGSREWVVGRPLIGYVDQPDMRRVLDALATSSKAFGQSLEIRVRAAKGPRVVQMLTRRTCLPGSRPSFHIAMVDLTDMRRLEEERRQADRERQRSQEAERVARAASEAKDEFLAMLSHELRTPLTPILAAVDSLAAHEKLPEPLAGKIEIIRRNVKAEARLIDDLLDLARITGKKLELRRAPIDLHAVVGEVAEAWKAPLGQRNITLEVRLDAGASWVDGDAARLGQVFRNVVNNAAKFTEPGGRIRLATENDGGSIVLTVSDTGIGMTRAEIEGLFTPFVQSRQGSARRGLGLGLVISKAIVDAHEGTLEIASDGRGAGTTARLDFETVPKPAHLPAGPAARATPEAMRAASVLLVEDDPDSAEMLALLLSREGFQVKVATSMRAARTLAGSCEVLVSDIALPDGNGLDLMRELREQRPMRGIALSGYGSSEDRRRSLTAGFEEHLTKPADLDELVAAVRRLAAARG
jgi:two-component system CheB/CheR fusion protein